MPGYWEASPLVDAGPEAVKQYQRAKQAAAQLGARAGFRDGLANLGVCAEGFSREVELGSRHVEVSTRAGAEQAAGAMKAGGELAPWGPLLTLGPNVVRRFRWLTPAEHEAELRHLPAGLEGDLVPREDGFPGMVRRGVEEVRI